MRRTRSVGGGDDHRAEHLAAVVDRHGHHQRPVRQGHTDVRDGCTAARPGRRPAPPRSAPRPAASCADATTVRRSRSTTAAPIAVQLVVAPQLVVDRRRPLPPRSAGPDSEANRVASASRSARTRSVSRLARVTASGVSSASSTRTISSR